MFDYIIQLDLYRNLLPKQWKTVNVLEKMKQKKKKTRDKKGTNKQGRKEAYIKLMFIHQLHNLRSAIHALVNNCFILFVCMIYLMLLSSFFFCSVRVVPQCIRILTNFVIFSPFSTFASTCTYSQAFVVVEKFVVFPSSSAFRNFCVSRFMN